MRELPDVKHFDPDAVLDRAVALFWERGAATTGIADVVEATGLSRSSLYATFGSKQELYVTALRRYVDEQSRPVFRRLADDGRGLPAIAAFFERLVRSRCSGEHARWGCMVSNAHAGPDRDDLDVRQVLDTHHDGLRQAMHAALQAARARSQVPVGLDLDSAADLLALLAYGVNLRSRAGAAAADLLATTTTALHALSGGPYPATSP
ncbi:TetR/AcrR family transcriptional regulator [Actinoallomurus sp. NPDC050550]|uniref:TetR/AcrR family transcriptional regulator n=1 Tax=Actinoallomurus sp. NPDC050550 TaxID=3154937 RepID=UPI0033DB1002